MVDILKTFKKATGHPARIYLPTEPDLANFPDSSFLAELGPERLHAGNGHVYGIDLYHFPAPSAQEIRTMQAEMKSLDEKMRYIPVGEAAIFSGLFELGMGDYVPAFRGTPSAVVHNIAVHRITPGRESLLKIRQGAYIMDYNPYVIINRKTDAHLLMPEAEKHLLICYKAASLLAHEISPERFSGNA